MGNLFTLSMEVAQQEAAQVGPEIGELIIFLNSSPTAFHAVEVAKKLLKGKGYKQISEREDWNLEAGKKYFFTRNYSTIVAFAIGKKYVAGNGFIIIGAHTDSPCLKLKPVTKVTKGGYLEVGVQAYGDGLWHTWFDRDLTVAGKVIIREEKDGSVSYSHHLVRIERPIMRIPTLAIHLDRGVNDGFEVNTENHLLPVLATSIKAELNKVDAKNGPVESGVQTDKMKTNQSTTSKNGPVESGVQTDTKKTNQSTTTKNGPVESGVQTDKMKTNQSTTTNNSKHHSLLLQLIASEVGCKPDDICDFELQACDTQALVDATSSESSLENETGIRMVALFDHEEVGSDSAQGAGSPALLNALSRITSSFGSDSKLPGKAIQRSFLVCADMAHALHPNYMDKHEDNHQPKLHGGLVIKNNANQRYATNSITSFIFREIATKHNLPFQDFVVCNDMACGSTIGPILASGVGIRTVDVGAPQLSMHSIREMCAVDDVKHSYEHFKAYFQEFSQLDAKITVDI